MNQKVYRLLLVLALLPPLGGCVGSGPGLLTPQIAASNLNSSASFTLSGSATNPAAPVPVIFADSTGMVSPDGNNVAVDFNDPALPLSLSSTDGVFAGGGSKTCNIDAFVASLTGNSGNEVSTQISANDCADQEILTLILNGQGIQDAAGNPETSTYVTHYLIDLAPAVSVAAASHYSISKNPSISVTFSKDLTGGALDASLSGCDATLSAATLDSSGEILTWTLTGSLVAGQTCQLDVSAIADVAGNPVDPNDPNLTMTFILKP